MPVRQLARAIDIARALVVFASPVAVTIPPRTVATRAGAGLPDEVDAGSQAPSQTTAQDNERTSFAAAGYDFTADTFPNLLGVFQVGS